MIDDIEAIKRALNLLGLVQCLYCYKNLEYVIKMIIEEQKSSQIKLHQGEIGYGQTEFHIIKEPLKN